MMHYKVNNESNIGIGLSKPSNDNLFSDITEDYTVYFNIPNELQRSYNIMFNAIYSCLMQVNEYESRSKAYKELSSFLSFIKTNTNAYFEIKIEEGRKFSVIRREKPKKLTKVINSLRRVA
jgi:hypothetical protein